MVRSLRFATLSRLLVGAALAACLATAVGPIAHPTAVAASTAGSMESQILGWVNAERSKRGLVPLRLHAGLVDLAGDRAATMASTGVMAHPSCLSCVGQCPRHPVVRRRRGHRVHDLAVGRAGGQEHLQRLEGQPTALGPAHEQPVQLHRHRGRVPRRQRRDVRRGRADRVERPDEAIGEDGLGVARWNHDLVDLVRGGHEAPDPHGRPQELRRPVPRRRRRLEDDPERHDRRGRCR